MPIDRLFRFVSYLVVICGFISLWVSGSFGIISTSLFVAVVALALWLEDGRYQLSERLGTVLIVLALPVFYLAWKLSITHSFTGTAAIPGVLSRMILALTAVKLLQKKGDRDWIFLYLMSFFEVLLAAGLSISALYLASFLVYVFVAFCATITLEIRRVSARLKTATPAAAAVETTASVRPSRSLARRLPTAAAVLLATIIAVALPLFFVLPRVGGAPLGGDGRGMRTYSGFSDSVRLGGIGRIQQSDDVVMRIRTEDAIDTATQGYFRGVALDEFDNISWQKSRIGNRDTLLRGASGAIEIDQPGMRPVPVTQTVYLEPLDTPVVFAVPRATEIEGGFSVLYRDSYGSLIHPSSLERVSYTVTSDTSVPAEDALRRDTAPYGRESDQYLQLPENYDKRIFELGRKVTEGAENRFDKAVAVRNFLRSNYGYTLEQKASGDEPLADFLFNVREGHCEYFATAMAVMLRTQGVATRVVNGYHGGEFNTTSGVTVVRQRNAHSWVEVYFPEERAWVTFDPTPFASAASGAEFTGFTGAIAKYLDAAQTLWIEYFVAYDDQGQESLARSVKRSYANYQADLSAYVRNAEALIGEWWAELRGDKGLAASLSALGIAFLYLFGLAAAAGVAYFAARLLKKHGISKFRLRGRAGQGTSVEFYERMLAVLAERGEKKEPSATPLEFAARVGNASVGRLTEIYNRVRFGGTPLSKTDELEADSLLTELEQHLKNN